ncbi:uncharacterized protein LOC129581098 [Paramacrobiotus metropolitanus]|uniref:uncharacterized protein LOC129581098 n=1 Tax=Paramacrobiotus metropolitanus TaxID=2943436 RepID=UPI0024460650|nr:uncharacterized protein LOC129581098 [Paramacrobiotus metropolitanus]
MAVPLCRCRVLYLGCAVPKITKDGLQGIQDPLKDIYPEGGAADVTGIDAWLSVWSNGLLLEYLDSMGLTVTKFMPIETLHYCAAVRYVEVTAISASTPISEVVTMRFFPLDHHQAAASPHHPPLFSCIMRRTSGIKVLECHGFICKNEMAANALVRACFHAFSDSMHLRLYDFVPRQAVPVIIPKTKSIFKFGKKSRSKSLGPPRLIPMRPAATVNLDPYANVNGNYRIYNDWRSPSTTSSGTSRPVYLATHPTPRLVKSAGGDYRYASNAILSSASSSDRIGSHQRKYQRVWSGSSQSGSEREQYIYGNNQLNDHYSTPLTNSHTQRPTRARANSRRSQNDSDYADVVVMRHQLRHRLGSTDDVYSASAWTNPMTSYQPGTKPPSRTKEEYYETSVTETKKGKKNNAKMEEHEQSSVTYYRTNPAPYMSELERTLSNGQHLPRRNSGYKRYESMPDLNKINGAEVTKGRDELPGLMNGMRLQGSAGSADQTSTGNTTPISTPATSLNDSLRGRKRNGRPRTPEIPEADYYH